MPSRKLVTGKGQSPASKSEPSLLWRALVSPRFTAGLLVIVLYFSLLGLLLPQSGTSPIPLEKRYPPEVLYFLTQAGLTDLFRSGWFIVTLVVLALNLLMVLADRGWPVLREAFRKNPAAIQASQVLAGKKLEEKHLGVEFQTVLAREAFRDLVKDWCKKRMSKPSAVRDEGGLQELQMSAQQGRFSRLSVWIAHASILVILAGAAMEFFLGFDGQVVIDEGSRARYLQILRGNTQKWPGLIEKGRVMPGFYEPGFEVELSKVKIDSYPESEQARSIRSFLHFFQGGRPIGTRQVAINEPVRFRDLTFTQGDVIRTAQSKMTLALKESQSGEIQHYSGLILNQKYDVEGASFRVLELQEGEETGLSTQIEYTEAGKQPERFWVFQKFPKYDETRRKESRYTFAMESVEPRYSSQIRVSRNPGLPVVAGGLVAVSLFLLAGVLFSLNRYWFVWKPGKVSVIGWSSRLSLFEPEFEREMNRFKSVLARQDKSIKPGAIEVKNGAG